jgi:hypothetical protein
MSRSVLSFTLAINLLTMASIDRKNVRLGFAISIVSFNNHCTFFLIYVGFMFLMDVLIFNQYSNWDSGSVFLGTVQLF